MLFVSPFFLLVFLPATLALFFAVRAYAGFGAVVAFIFLVSCLFYSKWGLFFLELMLIGTVVNYLCGAALVRIGDSQPRSRLTILIVGQLYNFGTLAFFKYLDPVRDLIGLSPPVSPTAATLIPIGISFYTFQQAVFLVDAYRRDPVVARYLGDLGGIAGGVRGFFRYGAFHCFFPQLVIGPITYLSEFAPQVMRKGFGRFRRTDMEVGLTLFILGLFKKLVLADSLALIADPAFTAAHQGLVIASWQAWVGVLAYFVQLYFDFSGYSDMALGTARLLGVRLPANFDSPLRSTGLIDFYRRWHMSLTRVIGRFLFTPLSLWGARRFTRLSPRAPARRLTAGWLPLFVNFSVIALWHGALPTFFAFGAIHSLWYILEVEIRGSKAWRAYKKKVSERSRRMLGQGLTFLPLLLTFALFRAESLTDFAVLMRSLFHGGTAVAAGIRDDVAAHLWVAVGFAVVWLMPNAYEFTRRYRPAIRIWNNPSTTPALFRFVWRPNMVWACVIVLMAAACVPFVNRETVFIYMGF